MEFKEFIIKMFKRLIATKDFSIVIDCGDDIRFTAEVIGYSEDDKTVNVRLRSNNRKELERNRNYKQIVFDYNVEGAEDCVKIKTLWWHNKNMGLDKCNIPNAVLK